MKILCNIFLISTILLVQNVFSQTSKITQILQNTLKQENEVRTSTYIELDSVGNHMGFIQQDTDSLVAKEAFVIKNDTLFYTTKHSFQFEKGYYLKHQKVALKDIKWVTKDIGVFFETQNDQVLITQEEFFEDGHYVKNSKKSNLFRTHFVSLRDNEYLAYELVKAFRNAGYKIEKGSWYD